MRLELVDSQYIDGKHCDSTKASLFCQLVDRLHQDVEARKIDFFSLSGRRSVLNEALIRYLIDATSIRYRNHAVVDRATFYTSHYIGVYAAMIGTEPVEIIIRPRFGDGIMHYLMAYAYGLYLPKGISGNQSSREGNLWLLALIWKAALQKAMTKSQIPKNYRPTNNNLNTFKGRLNIAAHLRDNLFDKSRFHCDYRELTMDTVINRTVRYAYKLLERKGFGALLGDIAEYDRMLHAFGVRQDGVAPGEIEAIRYSKLTIHYKKVMDLSALIIKNQAKSGEAKRADQTGASYFLDIAELWEGYLLKLLQKHLPDYRVYSPNQKGGVALFDDGSRTIRPDIIIEKNGKTVAVLDAKYKWYDKIGRYADIDNSVSRDDLYQMTTYLYHYGKGDDPICGIFVSPMPQHTIEIKTLQNHTRHKIGVINLDLKQFDRGGGAESFSRQTIGEEEKKFVENIQKAIENIQD